MAWRVWGVSRRKARLKASCLGTHSLLVTGYTMLKQKQHYQELGANFFDKLNKEQVKKSCLNRLDKLGYAVTLQAKTDS